MDRQNIFDRFYFDDYCFFHDNIGTVATLETNAFINQGQFDLPLKSQAGAGKLKAQTIFIDIP